jgi:predicted ArsR family transcriptional regulator
MAEERAHTGGRETVLAALRSAQSPLTVGELADDLGLHANTVRGHLELLVHLGLAAREAEVRTRRGRPRILYSAEGNQPAKADAYRTLATVLADELSIVAPVDQSSSDEAGDRWASALVAEGRLTPTDDADAALAEVAELFDELGFDTTTEPLGDRLYLQACPYASIRATFPGVCELHLSLLRGALSATGSGLRVSGLDVEPKPGLCIAHLQQPKHDTSEETA